MDQDTLLQQFCSITGANPQDGRFFLEANNWDVSAATSSFFDRDQGGSQPQQTTAQTSAPKPTPPVSKPKAQPASSGRIKGFSDLGGGDDSDDDDEEGNYYAGGEKSGLQIQDPNKKKKSAQDIVQDVFESAKKHGAKTAEQMPVEEKEKFTGSGYKLGNTVEPSRIELAAPKPVKQGPVTKTISFYKNGFTIDDGPLRNYTDPQNASFLADINKGVIPRELEREAANGDMQINLMDKKNEEWKEPPKPKIVPFSGSGNTLSGPSSSTAAVSHEVSSGPVKPVQFSIDESQPVTTLQIRLHDGTRMVAKFNHTHTVADVRRFVEMAKKTPPFDLLTSFPTKVLTDYNQTLKDAGLVNATIVQKLK